MIFADLHRFQPRFYRSAQLERDFRRADAMEQYCAIPSVCEHARRLLDGLRPAGTRRAWRIIGSYGSGKSSFALFMAHLLGGTAQRIALDLPTPERRLLPVLVTCAREPLANALARGLTLASQSVAEWEGGRRVRRGARNPKEASSRIPRADAASGTVADPGEVLESLARLQSVLAPSSGVLLVVDELGKCMEYAALHPAQGDLHLLQQLAEAATRSGDQPLMILTLLHQNFGAYADRLSYTVALEWEKVAGRFEELHFDQPLADALELMRHGLQPQVTQIPTAATRRMLALLEEYMEQGWFGLRAAAPRLRELVPALYPLHPAVLPVAIRFFRRYGQNERSIYGFLFGDEPFGFQAFCQRECVPTQFYRLCDFYDYVRANFGYRLGLAALSTHWSAIEGLIDSVAAEDAETAILKTVGILNLLDNEEFRPVDAAVCPALACSEEERRPIRDGLEALRRRGMLFFRGRNGGYCLWPHTSVNLADAWDLAVQEVPALPRVTGVIGHHLDSRALVARRHYIETGTLRWFHVRYAVTHEMTEALSSEDTNAAGTVLLVLCETEDERQAALASACSPEFAKRADLLVAVPQPLGALAPLLDEIRRWEWVETHTEGLNHDRIARGEVSQQIGAAREILQCQLDARLSPRSGQSNGLTWLCHGSELSGTEGLASLLSTIADELYRDAPWIRNELLNRGVLSSAGAGARTRLVEALFAAPESEYFGMDGTKRPPEMSMYLSLFREGRLHRQNGDHWLVRFPSADDDPCRLLPALKALLAHLEDTPDGRVPVQGLLDLLRRRPYGVRDGIAPLLLAVLLLVHQHDIALYEDGTFVSETGCDVLHRLLKLPQRFDLQYCRITGARATVLCQLAQTLGIADATGKGAANLVDAARHLCQFVGRLPEYTRSVKEIGDVAIAVRGAILAAREPVHLVFHALPQACGQPPLAHGKTLDETATAQYVRELRAALESLRNAYPDLKSRLRERLNQTFGLIGSPVETRRALAERALGVATEVAEMRLKGFAMRLLDELLPESEWLESIGTFLVQRPPHKWQGGDEALFQQQLADMGGRFLRAESRAFGLVPSTQKAYRVQITERSGRERTKVLRLSDQQQHELQSIRAGLQALLAQHGEVSLVAMSEILWDSLPTETDDAP